LYDSDRWADVFVRSGAKYAALTSKHHDGFILWRSAEANRAWGRPWNSVDIGPGRDLPLDPMEAGRQPSRAPGLRAQDRGRQVTPAVFAAGAFRCAPKPPAARPPALRRVN